MEDIGGLWLPKDGFPPWYPSLAIEFPGFQTILSQQVSGVAMLNIGNLSYFVGSHSSRHTQKVFPFAIGASHRVRSEKDITRVREIVSLQRFVWFVLCHFACGHFLRGTHVSDTCINFNHRKVYSQMMVWITIKIPSLRKCKQGIHDPDLGLQGLDETCRQEPEKTRFACGVSLISISAQGIVRSAIRPIRLF